MTAKEARELSQSVKANIEDVLREINSAATKGENKTHYYDRLSIPQRNRLLELGYTVSSIADRNDEIHTISW
jgi:hypothetical protein